MSDDIYKGQDSPESHEESNAYPLGKDGVDLSRRKFSKTGLFAAPVIYTLASKPAFGNHCTISGHLSGNLSRPSDHECGGCAPAFWQGASDSWPIDVDTLFFDATNGFGVDLYPGETMMQVIQNWLGGDVSYQLGAEAVAALLNSIALGEEIYGMTPVQVRQLFNDNVLIDPEGLKNTFQMMNERSCPFD